MLLSNETCGYWKILGLKALGGFQSLIRSTLYIPLKSAYRMVTCAKPQSLSYQRIHDLTTQVLVALAVRFYSFAQTP